MAKPDKDITARASSAIANIQERGEQITQDAISAVLNVDTGEFTSNSVSRNLLDKSKRPAAVTRKMLTWRTPSLGFVQMYINPSQMRISEKKIISSQRTKGGYVIQYGGEDLTDIAIEGTTGSSGIEGINILRSVYRSEQEAFNGIAQSLDEKMTAAQMYAMFKGASSGTTGAAVFQDPALALVQQTAKEAIFNIFDQPFPTLASLAASVELYFQGVLYKGYFTSFDVTERGESAGLFDYSMKFIAFARQGTRRNFMPWHRQPYNPAGSGANPLSFEGSLEELTLWSEPVPQDFSNVEDSNPKNVTFKVGISKDNNFSSTRGINVDESDLFVTRPPTTD